MSTYNLALIGFGGVNRALAELIQDEPQRFASLGFELRVVAITDLAFGSLVQGAGIDLAAVLAMPRGSSFEDSLAEAPIPATRKSLRTARQTLSSKQPSPARSMGSRPFRT